MTWGPPEITGVNPAVVRQGETVALTITGTNLLFGSLTTDNPGFSFTSSTGGDTQTTATLIVAADAVLGLTNVTVTASHGSDSTTISVLRAIPTVLGISPSEGSDAGGTPVTLSGTNFTSDTTSTIGGIPATDVVFVTADTMTATTPPDTSGSQVDVGVSNPDGSSTLTGGFFYNFPFFSPAAFALPTGGTGGFTLTLDEPVLVDTLVTLTSSNPAVASVPVSVVILAGERTVVIPVTAGVDGIATITMTIGDASLTTTIFVSPPFTGVLNPILAPRRARSSPRERKD